MNTKRIVEIMNKKSLTKYKLHKLTGLHQTAISNILNGVTDNPRINTVIKIAKALEVDINEII